MSAREGRHREGRRTREREREAERGCEKPRGTLVQQEDDGHNDGLREDERTVTSVSLRVGLCSLSTGQRGGCFGVLFVCCCMNV